MLVSPLAVFPLLLERGGTIPPPNEEWKVGAVYPSSTTSYGVQFLEKRLPVLQAPGQEPEPEHSQILRGLGYSTSQLLYRGDFRGPTDIQAAGGFDSHGKSLLTGIRGKWPTETDTGNAMTLEKMMETGSNLYYHAKYTNQHTQYVSMTTDMKVTKNFAAKPSNPGHVYVIHPSRAMIDLKNSIPAAEQKHSAENEVVAPHQVPLSQVLGWYPRSWDRETGEYSLGKLRLNEADIRVAPGSDTGSFSTQPGLARLPAAHDSATAPVAQALNRFLLENFCNGDENKYRQVRPETLEDSVQQMATQSGKRWSDLREKSGPDTINRPTPTDLELPPRPSPRPGGSPQPSPQPLSENNPKTAKPSENGDDEPLPKPSSSGDDKNGDEQEETGEGEKG